MTATRSLNRNLPGRAGEGASVHGSRLAGAMYRRAGLRPAGVLLVVAGLLLLRGVLPAQAIGGVEVIVQSVEGVVRYEASAGRFESIRADQRLSRDTVITTGLFSSVVLSVGEETVVIRAMQRGTVADLIAARTAARSRVFLGVSVAERDEVPTRTRPDVPAAPTRAADVATDILWVEDDDE